jgi:hypothetical protein
MAQVRAFSVPGVRMNILSGDHGPPHIHACRDGDWSAKIYIQASRTEMIRNVKPADARIKSSDRHAICEGIEAHRIELLGEWENCQGE